MHPVAIRRRLGSGWRLLCFDQVASTNDVVRLAAARGLGERLAVFADWQSAGRGRAGRSWIVPPGRGLLGSTLWRPPVPPSRAATLAQVAGVACVRALAGVPGLGLKWPNDVVIAGAKTGGVLIESALVGDEVDHVVIGIGLNVNQSEGDLPPTPYPATSLRLATGRTWPRAELAAALLRALDTTYREWLEQPSAIFHAWRRALVSLGRHVALHSGGAELRGFAEDVDLDGSLVVRLAGGVRRRFVSGEVSLRG